MTAMRIDSRAMIRLRWQRGWTRERLAAESGVTVGAIRSIESGRSPGSPPTAVSLAQAFGVDVLELTLEDDEQAAVS